MIRPDKDCAKFDRELGRAALALALVGAGIFYGVIAFALVYLKGLEL